MNLLEVRLKLETTHVKHKAIERVFSQQTQEGYWISKRITDSRSSNVDGTAFVLVDLSMAPELRDDCRVSRAITHLISNQNLDGGWSDLKGEPSRPTVTSYILEALGRSDARNSQEVERGVRWLEQAQCVDGGWTEIVERPWEGGIRPGETQPWITASCIRGLNSCPQSQKRVINMALEFLEETQRPDGSWEGRIGTDMVLLTFKEMGLTIEDEMVKKAIDYELSFLRPDGFLSDPWTPEDVDPQVAKSVMLGSLMHVIRGLHTFLGLGVSCEDERISKMLSYLGKTKTDLMEQLNKRANLTIFKILEELNQEHGFRFLNESSQRKNRSNP